MYKLIHKFESEPGKDAGDRVCRVANDNAKGDREILERDYLRIMNKDIELEDQKFFIVEVED